VPLHRGDMPATEQWSQFGLGDGVIVTDGAPGGAVLRNKLR
jgi:hypothetical protein